MRREFRLSDGRDFRAVYRQGSSVSDDQLVLFYLSKPASGAVRVGFSVSRKVGNAVIRNRVRRRLKEIIRTGLHRIRDSHDIVFLVRTPAAGSSSTVLAGSVWGLVREAGLLRRD